MRGYYYEENRLYPVQPPERSGRWKLVVLAVCLLVALTGIVFCLRIVWDMQAPAALDPPEVSRKPVQASRAPQVETTVERAPVGDGTTLTLHPWPDTMPHSLQAIYQENIQSIVSIRGEGPLSYSFGTGVILSRHGYIITNAHVIEGCSQLEIILQNNESYPALLVGKDSQTDLAVLKIDAHDLTPAVFGDSGRLQVGDTVVAIGNPLGQELRGTMTDGIVSAINRDVSVEGHTMSLIQTTAALNSGNSGGALINQYGQVVGITNMKMYAYDDTVEGLGFAIPTTTVKVIADVLMEKGVVDGRPAIGITCYTVTEDMAAEYDLPAGVRVESVEDGSDAKAQGIFPGDIIVEANGQSIAAIEDLLALKEGMQAGQVLHLRLWRDGVYLERRITLVEQYVLDGDGP